MTNGITIEITEQVYDLQLVTDKITKVEIYDFSVAGDVIPASLFTSGPGNMIVSAAADDPRQLDNVTVPPSDGYVLTWDSAEALKVKFKAAATSGAITLTNKSGTTVNLGDVVIFDKSNASAFTTTTQQGDARILGVAAETIAANASGKIVMGGIATVNVTGNVAIGQALISSTTPKYAMASGSAKQSGLVGYALTSYGGGSTGTVSALMFPNLERAGASVAVEGVLALNGSGTTGTLVCGTNSDRLVLALAFAQNGAGAPTMSAVPQVAGANMTQSGSDMTNFETSGYTLARLYYYKAVGTGNITVTNATFSASLMGCMFIALSGVAASSYLGTMASNVVTGTAQSVNCTNAIAGDLVVGFNVSADTATSLTASGSGQTNRINTVLNTELAIMDTKPATGATETMSWTLAASRKALNVSIPVRPL